MLQTLTFKVNVAPEGVPPVVRLSQNENGRSLVFDLGGSGTVNIPAGSTVTLSGTKPDGNVYSATGTLSGTAATFAEETQMTAVAGEWAAKLKVTYNGETIASVRICFIIDADAVAAGAVPSDSELQGLVAEAQAYAENARSAAYGSPLTASTVAGMTDTTRVYVYTGSETGYTSGHWYYYNGSAWTDGGTYNSQGLTTDTTLSIPGMAADAAKTGDELSDLKSALSYTEHVLATEHKTITKAYIASNGTLTSGGTNVVHCFRVPSGKSVDVTASANIVYGLYANEPSVGSVACDDRNHTLSSTEANIAIPSACNWVAIRTAADGTASVSPKSIVIDGLEKGLSRLWKQNIAEGVEITDGHYQHKDGSVQSSDASCITGFIPVKPQTKYRASKVSLTYNRSIYAYSAFYTGLSSIIDGSDYAEVEFTTPANCHYIRMTGNAGVAPELEFAEKVINQNIGVVENNVDILTADVLRVSKYAPDDITFIPSSLFENGGIAFSSSGPTYGWNANRIRIKSGYTVDLPKGSVVGLTDYTNAQYGFCGRRSDGTYGYVSNQTADRIVAEDFEDCVFVISYNPETYLSYADIPTLSNLLFIKRRPYTSSVPQITIIDDDTVSVAHVTKFYTQCNLAGIKGTFATIPYYLENASGLPELLKSYEEEGFQCVYHCYKQTNIYLPDTQYRDYAAMEADFVKGLDKMGQYRFGNFKYFVAPYGSHDSAIQNLARKWGMQCLVSIAQNYYETQSVVNDRWFIPRIGLNQHDADGAVTLAQLKEQMALCADAKGWVLIGTHFDTWDAEEGYSRFHEVVDYAESLGYTFTTLAEGFEKWRTNYDFKALRH